MLVFKTFFKHIATEKSQLLLCEPSTHNIASNINHEDIEKLLSINKGPRCIDTKDLLIYEGELKIYFSHHFPGSDSFKHVFIKIYIHLLIIFFHTDDHSQTKMIYLCVLFSIFATDVVNLRIVKNRSDESHDNVSMSTPIFGNSSSIDSHWLIDIEDSDDMSFGNDSHLDFVETKNCKITGSGDEYFGNIDVTLSGKLCQNWKKNWDSQTIISSSNTYSPGEKYTSDAFPNYLISNYKCRNPNRDVRGKKI